MNQQLGVMCRETARVEQPMGWAGKQPIVLINLRSLTAIAPQWQPFLSRGNEAFAQCDGGHLFIILFQGRP